jgi:hypothetical protein
LPDGQTQMSKATPAKESITVIGERNGLKLAIKHVIARGLREIISRLDLPDLIDGVLVEPPQVHPVDRGFLAELAWPVSFAVQLFVPFFSRMNFASAVMSLFSSQAGAFASGANSVQKNP